MNFKYIQLKDSIIHEINNMYSYVIHIHRPRNGSFHYDLRFEHPHKNVLLSFALGHQFADNNDKITCIRTRDHDKRWLSLKSYRLDVLDRGELKFNTFTEKFINFNITGKILNGRYSLFTIKDSKRNDRWLLIKK